MSDTSAPVAKRAVLTFLLAMAGSVTGMLAGPRLVAAAEGSTPWLLPLVMAASVLLAFVAAYAAFRISAARAAARSAGDRGEG